MNNKDYTSQIDREVLNLLYRKIRAVLSSDSKNQEKKNKISLILKEYIK